MALGLILALISSFKWQLETAHEFEERQMDIQVNYSIDAAIQEMLINTSHLNTDYTEFKKISVDPQIGYDIYIRLMLKNLNWSEGEENVSLLESDMIPFFCVAAYDGYYMKIRQENIIDFNGVKQASYELVWTPKLPYSYVKKYGEITKKFAVNLSYKNPMCIDNNNLILKYKGKDLSEDLQRKIVADTLSDACNKALLTGFSANAEKEFFIPSSLSKFRGSNNIDGVTILTYLSKDGNTSRYSSGVFAVGGSRINNANFCLGYKRGNMKCYCRPAFRSKVEGMGYHITNVFTSDKEAARKGYYYDNQVWND